MAMLLLRLVLLFGLTELISGKGGLYSKYIYRYDYEYSQEAEGWLKYHIIPSTWTDARFQCHAEGAVLFSPLTLQLKSAVVSFLKTKKIDENENLGGGAIFTGIHSTFAKGVYNSIEGVPLSKLAVTWAPGEPDNYENSESCLVMRIDLNGSMADIRCDNVFPYVCFSQLESSVKLSPDCGTIDPEYIYEPETGSCYKYHTKIMSWSDAYKTCDAEGGYLAIINSEVEAYLIKNKVLKRQVKHGDFKAKYDSEIHIGYHDWGTTHNFMTVHGESLYKSGYQKWLNGQPNNVSIQETNDHGQLCGGVNRDGLLNNLYCNLPFSFICEMTPHSLELDYFVLK